MKIPVVNEKGEMIGAEERALVHEKGLLHPEIVIFIKLPNGKLVFQRRSLTKDTNPGKLTNSVTGHIDLDHTPQESAIKELEEETGIKEKIENLIPLGSCIIATEDSKTHTIDNTLRYFFAYNFKGSIEDLVVEPNDGDGFVEYSLEELRNLSPEDKEIFSKSIFTPEMQVMFDKFK